jgi:CubicO group peptidase (beta-lactamase class C family)
MLRIRCFGKLWLLLAALTAAAPSEPAPPARPKLAAAIQDYARAQDFSGTILVARDGQVRYRRSFGLAERGFAVPATAATRYRIASITKLFTSVLILQLIEEGRIDLARPAGTYLPELTGEIGARVTVHNLLNHSSGIAQWDHVSSYQEAFAKGVDRYQRPLSPETLVAMCCMGKLASEPGARFDYNNADYFLLGRIVERVTGKSFEAALTERILRPLGMRDTGMLRWDSIVERLAPTYFWRDDERRLVRDMPVYYENWYAAAGMYSTAADLLTFAEALFGGRLGLGAGLERLLAPGLDDYGYGLWSYTVTRGGRDYRVAKRPGSMMGANAMLYRLRDGDSTVVILANTNRADLDVFAQRIADVLIAGR